jgi:hypothetical protein
VRAASIPTALLFRASQSEAATGVPLAIASPSRKLLFVKTPQFIPLLRSAPRSNKELKQRAADFREKMEQRRTVRDFSERRVPREVIEDFPHCRDCAERR